MDRPIDWGGMVSRYHGSVTNEGTRSGRRSGAPVAVPEVPATADRAGAGDPRRLVFTFADVLGRLDRIGDPFASMSELAQSVPDVGNA
jgi:DNA primase